MKAKSIKTDKTPVKNHLGVKLKISVIPSVAENSRENLYQVKS
jgi:hypothetical protein